MFLLSLLTHCWGFRTRANLHLNEEWCSLTWYLSLDTNRGQKRISVGCWVTCAEDKCYRNSEGDDLFEVISAPDVGHELTTQGQEASAPPAEPARWHPRRAMRFEENQADLEKLETWKLTLDGL